MGIETDEYLVEKVDQKSTYEKRVVKRNIFGLFQSEWDHRNVVGLASIRTGCLVHFHRRVERSQLLFQQLKVGIDKTQL